MVRAAELTFVAMAVHAQRKATAWPIRCAVLQEMAPMPSDAVTSAAPSIQRTPIADPAHAWLMTDADFATYAAECDRRERAAGLVPSTPGNCPVLEAEACLHQSENALIDVVGATLPRPLSSDGLHGDLRQRAVDLCLRLLAPFVRDSGRVLDTFMPPQPGSVRAAAHSPALPR